MSMNSQIISSEEIFRLYDTYGFPTDLVQMLAEEHNVKLDFSKFEECKEKARELSKKINNEITEIILSDVSVTDDQFKYTENGISGRLQFFTLEKKIIKFNRFVIFQRIIPNFLICLLKIQELVWFLIEHVFIVKAADK